MTTAQILTIIIATVSNIIFVGIFSQYIRFWNNRLPGFRYCLAVIAVGFSMAMLTMIALFVKDHSVLMVLTAFVFASSLMGNTLMALTLIPLIGDFKERIIKNIKFLILLPLVVYAMAATNHLHHWIIQDATSGPNGFGFTFEAGILSIPVGIYSYAMLGSVVVMAIWYVRNYSKKNRKLLLIIVVFSMVPSAIGFVELFVDGMEYLHWSSFSMAFALAVITSTFYGYLYTARPKAIEHSNEIYIVFDRWGACADMNTAARELFGKYMGTFRPSLKEFLNLIHIEKQKLVDEVENEFDLVDDGGVRKYYRIKKFTISDSLSKYCGDGFLIREITEFREKMEKLNTLATHDALTGVKNRRYFYAYSAKAIEQAAAHGNVITVLMLDIDHFKSINDTHGHIVGDEVLVALCRVCDRALRSADTFCRLGGEEFAVMIENRGEEAGREMAQRLLKEVHKQPFVTSVGKVPVTVSIGGCSMAAKAGDSIDKWLDLADQMMYKAKQRGGDRMEYDVRTPIWEAFRLRE